MNELPERITRKINKQGVVMPHMTTACWEWQGATNGNGYGKVRYRKRQEYTHRATYMHYKGEIPGGLEVDHVCRNRICCNPDHLEAITPYENTIKNSAPNIIAYRENRCIHGHELTEENTYLINEKRRGVTRRCAICRKANNKRYKDRKKAHEPGQV